jgi:hypothetical protein
VVARLAVDGKALRGSARTDGKPLQLLSAVTHRLRLTLAQVPIEDKSNEISAFPKGNQSGILDHAERLLQQQASPP